MKEELAKLFSVAYVLKATTECGFAADPHDFIDYSTGVMYDHGIDDAYFNLHYYEGLLIESYASWVCDVYCRYYADDFENYLPLFIEEVNEAEQLWLDNQDK